MSLKEEVLVSIRPGDFVLDRRDRKLFQIKSLKGYEAVVKGLMTGEEANAHLDDMVKIGRKEAASLFSKELKKILLHSLNTKKE